MKHLIPKTMTAVPVLALALAVGGCGGSSSDDMMTELTPDQKQAMCESDGGRWNADMTCTSAADLAMERATTQTKELMTAADAVEKATAGLSGTPSQDAIDTANMKIADLQTALDNAADVSDAVKGGYQSTLDTAKGVVSAAQTARNTADDQKRMDDEKAMAAAGKALHGALGSTPLGNLNRSTNPGGALLAATGLTINTIDTADTDPVLEAGDSAGALGSWNGMNYARMDATTKASHAAVVYTNQGAPTMTAFGTVHATGYDEPTRTLTLTADADDNVKGSSFPTVGTKTFSANVAGGDEVSFQGTYDGVTGTYFCTIATGTPCTAQYSGAEGITLGTNWSFVHPKDAKVPVADANYLHFGWWLTKDEDDKPTSASAFHGVVGTAPTTPDSTTITGSATYSGHAAGKFAISNPLGGSDAGHFTADVMLTAKFGVNAAPNNGGISGTVDNFMANDKSVPWSVELQRAQWGTSGAFASIPDDTSTTDVDEETGTVWSIDGNAAPMSGDWNGQMYDEATSGAADDGSNVPTTAVGVFQSMFGSTHTMVGAFGATKE